MGIYIKGLTEEEFKSVSWECTYKALKRQGRIIEVKEPHGRLIDADALMKESDMTRVCDDCTTDTFKCHNGYYKYDKAVVCAWVDSAPTVIEAEVE